MFAFYKSLISCKWFAPANCRMAHDGALESVEREMWERAMHDATRWLTGIESLPHHTEDWCIAAVRTARLDGKPGLRWLGSDARQISRFRSATRRRRACHDTGGAAACVRHPVRQPLVHGRGADGAVQHPAAAVAATRPVGGADNVGVRGVGGDLGRDLDLLGQEERSLGAQARDAARPVVVRGVLCVVRQRDAGRAQALAAGGGDLSADDRVALALWRAGL